MIGNELEYFVDDSDICINEVEISGDERIENTEFISNNLEIFNITTNDESYLSESTEAMTDSEIESNYLSCDESKIKTENDTFRDISNNEKISLRPRKSIANSVSSVSIEIKSEPMKKCKRKHNLITSTKIPDEYYVGRLLWAKVKSHPWWPCMIYQSPEDIFYKEMINKKTIHVVYFGPYVQRGWVNISNIMSFEGKMKFDDFVKQLQENKSPKHILQQYVVCQSRLKMYDESWKEADSAMMLPLEERIKIHGISYKNLNGETSSSESDEKKSNIEESDVETELSEVESEPVTCKKQKLSTELFEFERLKLPTFANCKRNMMCFLCLKENEESTSNCIVQCSGGCGQQFHPDCLKLLFEFLTSREPTTKEINYLKCVDCNRGVRRCFICQKLVKNDKKDEMMKCSTSSCGRFYHSSCLYNGLYGQLITYNRSGSLTCPSHICHACYVDDPEAVKQCSNHIRCLMCPSSYHKGDWCIPAGSKEINDNYIICPKHLPSGGCSEITVSPFINCIQNGILKLKSFNFQITSFNDPQNKDLWILEKPLKVFKSKSHNVTWCFLCPEGGKLICCESCPASLHQHCAAIDEIPDVFTCDECESGRYPRYGSVYWLKIGTYRWWPGQIIHPKNAPEKVLKASHGEGQFLVQFFATNDYYWLNKTHAFPFEDGDDKTGEMKRIIANHCVDEVDINCGNKKLDRDYERSLKIAAKVLLMRTCKWEALLNIKNKPSQYRSITANIPIGNVRINKPADLSEIPQCECRPCDNNNDPCGPSSDCVNRELMYECHPLVCRNGDKCRNQRFIKREYPKQEVFPTTDRGWALRTLGPIKKGEFVNEYVGELIDEAEANRRLKKAHDSNITNFYMMELDGQRIIDAGPSANISRFMNHSCSPNVYTEKWTVNGDTRIGLFALHNIKAGEELTFNYNFFSLGQKKVPCKCGSNNCSGFLGDPPKLSSLDNESPIKDSLEIKKSQVSVSKNDKKLCQKRSLINKNSFRKSPVLHSQKSVDDDCYRCGQLNCDIVCSHDHCPRVYHLKCVSLTSKPKNLWLCPWHCCDDCGRLSEYFCSECTTSYCSLHRFNRLVKLSNENMICSNHEDLFLSHGSPTESQNGSINATLSITGTDSLPSISI